MLTKSLFINYIQCPKYLWLAKYRKDLLPDVPDEILNDNVSKSVLLAIQEIKDISVKAKEQNIHITERITTPELLAFELYGSATDENVSSIINDNDLFGRNSINS